MCMCACIFRWSRIYLWRHFCYETGSERTRACAARRLAAVCTAHTHHANRPEPSFFGVRSSWRIIQKNTSPYREFTEAKDAYSSTIKAKQFFIATGRIYRIPYEWRIMITKEQERFLAFVAHLSTLGMGPHHHHHHHHFSERKIFIYLFFFFSS